MRYQVICVGSGSKDVFFPTDEMIVMDNPDKSDINVQKLIAFEYGAKYQIDDRFEAPGGCAANAAQGLARLGINTACCCRVGLDSEGAWVKKSLEHEKVATDLVQEDSRYKTDLSLILVNKKTGERTIFFNRDANEKLEIYPDELSADWIFVSALNGKWQEHLETILEHSGKKNILLAYNPGEANIQRDRGKVMEFVKGCHLLMANRDEATEMVSKNNDDLQFLMKELKAMGPEIVVITDGSEGAYCYDGQRMIFAPAIVSQKPLDFTGAGDGFSAAFLAAHIKGLDLSECLKWGTANGANVVDFYGAKEGLLNEEEIMRKSDDIEIKEI
jgi:ribokinase